jgi:large subunit ribosomal protein L15
MADAEEIKVPILSRLKPPEGAVRRKKRVGRGPGSGLGKTAGRGQKGQKARQPGGIHKLGFEGGQTPMQRRLPKTGFHNLFSKKVVAINVDSLQRFEAGAVVDAEALRNARLIRREYDAIKILGQGELDRALTVRAHAFSASAKEKIEKAGGKAEMIEAKAAAKAGSAEKAD